MIISFINSENQIMTFLEQENIILQQWDGFANTAHSLRENKAPGQIGSTVINKIYQPRAINIQFLLKGNNRQVVFDLRKELISKLNPDLKEGKLIWQQNDGKAYQINAELENLEMPGGDAQGQAFQTVQVSFLCADPRWFDIDSNNFILPANSDFTVFNEGHTKTDCMFEISGPVINPNIINLTTGKKIALNIELLENQKININTKFGEKTVEFIDENGKFKRAMNILDLDSELFYLEREQNALRFEGAGINENTFCEINFYNRFLGV